MAQGGDPIPDADEVKEPYRVAVRKEKNVITFSVNDLEVFRFEDDGETYGPLLQGGKIGFRQLAPLVAEYGNLKVYEI